MPATTVPVVALAPTPPTTPQANAALDAHIASLQTLIAAQSAGTAAMRTQLQTLAKQIQDAEGHDVAQARQDLQMLQRLKQQRNQRQAP